MWWLSLVLAFVLLVVALFGFMGGVGPLIAIGEYAESFSLPNPAIWALQLAYIGVLFGGVICCIVCFRGLRRAYRPLLVGYEEVHPEPFQQAAGLASPEPDAEVDH